MIDEGVLAWCDADGTTFDRIRDLEKAKHAGKAYLRIVNRIGLPSPFELTGDPQWAEGGSLFTLYDLHLDDDDYVINQDVGYGDSVFTVMEGIGAGNPYSTSRLLN